MLWDVFPEGRRMGGAPINFACHCRQMGAESFSVSCVGRDALGEELLQVLSSWDVDASCVSREGERLTGTVNVVLDPFGKPSYEICENVAWDAIPISDDLADLAKQADAACFGSLGQRSEISRTTIGFFLRQMRFESLKVFDVNLRQDFFSAEIISNSLDLANVLKLSDEELPVLAEMFGLTGGVEDQLKQLIERFTLRLVAYTRGPDGSLLITSNGISDHSGCTGAAVDSVGAGDSFTAALCMGLLRKQSLDEINEYANRVATFVCSQRGATPKLPKELVQGVLSYA